MSTFKDLLRADDRVVQPESWLTATRPEFDLLAHLSNQQQLGAPPGIEVADRTLPNGPRFCPWVKRLETVADPESVWGARREGFDSVLFTPDLQDMALSQFAIEWCRELSMEPILAVGIMDWEQAHGLDGRIWLLEGAPPEAWHHLDGFAGHIYLCQREELTFLSLTGQS